jgi:hypothetical protein
MERRTFLLALIGSLAAAGLAPTMATSANALSLTPPTPSEGAVPADISADDLDGLRTEDAQYYRRRARRVYRRYYRRPYRRYRRRVRRYWRRGRWYY